MAKTTTSMNDTRSEIEKISIAAAEAIKVIAKETAETSKGLAEETAAAAKLLATAASDVLKITSTKNSEDHDLIIEIRGQLNRVIDDIRKIENGTFAKITDLQNSKADKCEFEELKKDIYGVRERRIRSIENKVANYFITLTIYTLAAGGCLWMIIDHISKT